MSDLWPQENEKEAFQLGLSPVLYCSLTKIVMKCEWALPFSFLMMVARDIEHEKEAMLLMLIAESC